ncbi:MAG: hypothetical protein RIA69_15005 [Cyclobacteriaceae bacterium]
MIKLSVIGTKDFKNLQLLTAEIQKENPEVLVVGGKPGSDQLAQQYGMEMDILTQIFPPDYGLHGRSANYQRNLEMIRNSNRILIFWNQQSKGLFNYLPYIKEQKKKFRTVLY